MFNLRKVQIFTHQIQDTFITIYDSETFEPEIISSAYLISMQQNGQSLKTIENHANTLRFFLNSVLASSSVNSDWRRITPAQLSRYQEMRAYSLSAGSYEQMTSILKNFFDWCYDKGWIENKVTYGWKLSHEKMAEIVAYRASKKSKDPFNLYSKYISEDQFKYLLGFDPSKKSYLQSRNSIVLKLGYYCGLRRSEVTNPLNFTIQKVRAAIEEADKADKKGFDIAVIGKGRSGGKSRVIKVPMFLREEIERFMRSELKRSLPNAKLLINRLVKNDKGGFDERSLSEGFASKLFKEFVNNLLQNGDMELSRVWNETKATRSFHCLRHSYATNFADEINYGNNNEMTLDLLQERMGHSHSSTTKIYLWFSAKNHQDEELAARYESALKSSSAKREMSEDE